MTPIVVYARAGVSVIRISAIRIDTVRAIYLELRKLRSTYATAAERFNKQRVSFKTG
jgi:hypothetical protein